MHIAMTITIFNLRVTLPCTTLPLVQVTCSRLGIASAECSRVATIRSDTQAFRSHNDLVRCNTELMFKRSHPESSVRLRLQSSATSKASPILHHCVSHILPSRWPDDFGPPLLAF